jgi:hypothetical protein
MEGRAAGGGLSRGDGISADGSFSPAARRPRGGGMVDWNSLAPAEPPPTELDTQYRLAFLYWNAGEQANASDMFYQAAMQPMVKGLTQPKAQWGTAMGMWSVCLALGE